MLCQFTFQNFKSYKSETTLDFQATALPEFKDTLITEAPASDLLPVSVVYGPNGGGKTTLAKVISGITWPKRRWKIKFTSGTLMSHLYRCKSGKGIRKKQTRSYSSTRGCLFPISF